MISTDQRSIAAKRDCSKIKKHLSLFKPEFVNYQQFMGESNFRNKFTLGASITIIIAVFSLLIYYLDGVGSILSFQTQTIGNGASDEKFAQLYDFVLEANLNGSVLPTSKFLTDKNSTKISPLPTFSVISLESVDKS